VAPGVRRRKGRGALPMWGLAVLLLALAGMYPGRPAEPVKIGLLLPATGTPGGEAMRRGAELAVAVANRAGGYRGRPFALVVRTEEGPWGTASKRVADLAAVDRVWAILGSVDGRSAHVVEQVVTKARLAFVSPWASDPTLAQINLPWFFRCVPDDRQQAAALVREIFEARRLARVVTVAESAYDGRMGEGAFARAARDAGAALAARLMLDPSEKGVEDVLRQLAPARPDGLVLFGSPTAMAPLVGRLRGAGLHPVLVAPLMLNEPAFLRAVQDAGLPAVVVAPEASGAAGQRFQAAYRQAYGAAPEPIAAYSFDGMNAILGAVRAAGLDRNAIQRALAATNQPGGATGPVRFDARGNRMGPVTLVAQ
jgi:branched-chain amino acid transport system substrate-binding protein